MAQIYTSLNLVLKPFLYGIKRKTALTHPSTAIKFTTLGSVFASCRREKVAFICATETTLSRAEFRIEELHISIKEII